MSYCCVCGATENLYTTVHGVLCETCLSVEQVKCYVCGCDGLVDDMVRTSAGWSCRHCHLMAYNFCHACGEQVHKRMSQYKIGDHYYCQVCWENSVTRCDVCREVLDDDYVRCRFGVFCPECFDHEYAYCSVCDSCFHCDYMVHTPQGLVCENCEQNVCEWDMKDFEPSENLFEELSSKRTFGIEIETARCPDYSKLHHTTIWGCTHDYSISGKEFISPPMYGDSGLSEVRDFCRQGLDKSWTTDNDCGLHLHVGIEDYTPVELKRIAYAYLLTYKLWFSFVSQSRDNSRMCGDPKYNIDDVLNIDTSDYEGWDMFVSKQDRFEFLNWRAYLVHGTVELRLMEGTLNGDKICNWVKAHIKFIDFVAKTPVKDLTMMFNRGMLAMFSAFAEIVGHELASYYVSVSNTNGKGVVATSNKYLPF